MRTILTGKFFIVGCCRISVDEELDRDNTSIEKQMVIIANFIHQKFPDSTLSFYKDRDYSGCTFEQRDDYQATNGELIAHGNDIPIIKDFCNSSAAIAILRQNWQD